MTGLTSTFNEAMFREIPLIIEKRCPMMGEVSLEM